MSVNEREKKKKNDPSGTTPAERGLPPLFLWAAFVLPRGCREGARREEICWGGEVTCRLALDLLLLGLLAGAFASLLVGGTESTLGDLLLAPDEGAVVWGGGLPRSPSLARGGRGAHRHVVVVVVVVVDADSPLSAISDYGPERASREVISTSSAGPSSAAVGTRGGCGAVVGEREYRGR